MYKTKNYTYSLTEKDDRKIRCIMVREGTTSKSETLRRIIDRIWREGNVKS